MTETIQQLLRLKIPNNNICILAVLARSKVSASLGDAHASHILIMTTQKVLLVRVIKIAHHYAATCGIDEGLPVWQVVEPSRYSCKSNRMLQLYRGLGHAT